CGYADRRGPAGQPTCVARTRTKNQTIARSRARGVEAAHFRFMGKALIIAEKPSVAADIAKALGGFKKHDDYYESDQYVLSSAVGHLLELAVPEEYEV